IQDRDPSRLITILIHLNQSHLPATSMATSFTPALGLGLIQSLVDFESNSQYRSYCTLEMSISEEFVDLTKWLVLSDPFNSSNNTLCGFLGKLADIIKYISTQIIAAPIYSHWNKYGLWFLLRCRG